MGSIAVRDAWVGWAAAAPPPLHVISSIRAFALFERARSTMACVVNMGLTLTPVERTRDISALPLGD